MAFFTEEHGVKKTPSAYANLAKTEQCLVCPRNNIKVQNTSTHPKMEAVGNKNPDIYFLGVGPSKVDDSNDSPFSRGDMTASILHEYLDDMFKDFYVKKEWSSDSSPRKIPKFESTIRFNNLLKCHDIAKSNELTLDCCRTFLEQDIINTKPKVIVGFGEIPLKAMVGVSGIADWRGRKIPIKIGDHTCWYFVLEGLDEILKKRNPERKYFVSTWEEVFKHDLNKLKKLLNSSEVSNPLVIPKEERRKGIEFVLGKGPEDLETIKGWLKELMTLPKIGLDLETSAIKIWTNNSKIYTVAIGTSKKVYAFPIEHPRAWDGQYKEIKKIFIDFLLEYKGIKVCHNDKFEKSWCFLYGGPRVLFETKWGCTMTRAFLLDSRSSKRQDSVLSLDMLSLMYFGFRLKNESSVDVENILASELSELLIYNGMDTKYTYALDDLQIEGFNTLLDKAYQHKLHVSQTLVLTEDKGFPVDKPKVEMFSKKLGEEALSLDAEIKNLPAVKLFEKTYGTFNPGSSPHLVKMFRDVLKLESVKNTKSGKEDSFSTDKDVLDIYAAKGIKLAELIKSNRELRNLKSTYVDSVPELCKFDGKIHTNFSHLFTSTGRLASSQPNLQNWPIRKNSYIRELIIAPAGYWMVSFDYGQIEAKVIAMLSKDPKFVKYVWDDFDVHGDWAARVAKKDPRYAKCNSIDEYLNSPDKKKKYRSIIKNRLVFPWFFGAGQKSVGDYLGFSETHRKELYDEFWELFGGIKKWQHNQIDFYEKNGYIETITGHRRYGPMTYNEKVNGSVQGSASDIVTDAMNRLSVMAFELEKPQLQIVLNVHDDLTFFLPEKTLEEDIETIAKEMCVSPFKEINVPLTLEAKLGSNWGNMKEFAVFKTTDFLPN
jgi:DNA polymerase I-like protein with 3'-5' exonuclease and polymerase domains/uracil-DNA glycosylase